MPEAQTIIAVTVVAGAAIYATWVFIRKSRAFSTKEACGDECGCSAKSKTPRTTH